MKKLILVIMLILIQIPVLGEDFPPIGAGIEVTKETNPIYWGYLEDYGKALKQALESKKMFRLRGWGAEYRFTLTRDGDMKNMKGSIFQNEYYDNKVKEIILSVKPLPFREGMNMDEMNMRVYLGFQRYDEIDISIGGSFIDNKKVFSIGVNTSK